MAEPAKDFSNIEAPHSGQMPYAAGSQLRLSVVVPCYNEIDVLRELERRLVTVCEATVGKNYEIILINDGSTDGTWQLIETMINNHAQIVGIDLARNFGHQIALTAGLKFARGERVLILDADLQDPPELLPKMMRLMDRGANVVYGQRTEREGETWLKKLSAVIFYRVLRAISHMDIPIDSGDFRLIDSKVRDALLSMPEHDRFVRGMITWIGLNQVALPYARAPRFAGKTKYTFRKMLLFAVDATTGFSITPLRMSLLLSAIFMLGAVLLGLFALYSWVFFGAVRGWTSLVLLLLTFSSIQLLCLSIIGEYVGRTYMQTKDRPLFILRQIAVSPRSDANIHQHSRSTAMEK
jgi:polyisoprenyl-phosphate glycosyltransferase